jgi:hypothetical protein
VQNVQAVSTKINICFVFGSNKSTATTTTAATTKSFLITKTLDKQQFVMFEKKSVFIAQQKMQKGNFVAKKVNFKFISFFKFFFCHNFSVCCELKAQHKKRNQKCTLDTKKCHKIMLRLRLFFLKCLETFKKRRKKRNCS